MPTIEGHAAVFDSLSVELWGFFEEIAPGAFADSIEAGDDVRALFNHDPNYVLGRSRNGTLRLAEDEVGLRVEFEPPDTQQARDVVTLIERGDVNQMSFALRCSMRNGVSTTWSAMCGAFAGEAVRRQPRDLSGLSGDGCGRAGGGRIADVWGYSGNSGRPGAGRQAAADGDQAQGRMDVLRLRLEVAERA